MFDCCSSKYRLIQSSSFQNQCTVSLGLLTELTSIFDLTQTSPDLHTVHSHVLQVKVYWAIGLHRNTSRLPLYGPIDLHQSVRCRREETDWNTQSGFYCVSCLWLRSTLTPSKRHLDGQDASRPERHSRPSGCLNWCRVISWAKANSKRTCS